MLPVLPKAVQSKPFQLKGAESHHFYQLSLPRTIELVPIKAGAYFSEVNPKFFLLKIVRRTTRVANTDITVVIKPRS